MCSSTSGSNVSTFGNSANSKNSQFPLPERVFDVADGAHLPIPPLIDNIEDVYKLNEMLYVTRDQSQSAADKIALDIRHKYVRIQSNDID